MEMMGLPDDPAPLRALTLRHFQCFVVLAREQHFGRAAQRLSITQPALSNAIKQMERLLGAPLLVRSTHRLALTALGAEVLERADFVVNTMDQALRDIRAMVVLGRAQVRIGVIPSAGRQVAAAVAAFEARVPEAARVEWVDAPSTELVQRLRRGQLDVAVAAITEAPDGLACVDLFRDPLVLVVHRDHPFAAARRASWKALGRERLALFESGSMPALGGPARVQFGEGGPQPIRLRYAETLYALVRSRLAVGLMPRLYTVALRDPQLRVVPLGQPRIERRVVLLRRPEPLRSAAARRLVEYLGEQLPSLAGGESPVEKLSNR